MIINHNLSAMNTQRQLNISGIQRTKSSEKLSSGYRINRSADDAAGLTISEKMRSQIRGLDQGSRNVQDGISLLQVADGALAEVHDMLHRITELAIQSSNDTNNVEDRQQIQQEVNQLVIEIDRISNSTEFNKQKLFQGVSHSRSKATIHKPASGNGGISVPQQSGYHTEEVALIGVSNISWDGQPSDTSIINYSLDADVTNGIFINGTQYSWDNIKTQSGKALSTLEAGTYSISNNGLSFSMVIPEGASFEGIVNSIEDVEGIYNISSETTDIKGVRLYVNPRNNTSLSKEEYLNLDEQSHKIINSKIDGILSYGAFADSIPTQEYNSRMISLVYDSSRYPTITSLTDELNGSDITFQPYHVGAHLQIYGVHSASYDISTNTMNNYKFIESIMGLLNIDPNNVYEEKLDFDSKLIFDASDLKSIGFYFQKNGKRIDFELDNSSKAVMDSIIANGGMLNANTEYSLSFTNSSTGVVIQHTINVKRDTRFVDLIASCNRHDTVASNYSFPGLGIEGLKTEYRSGSISKTTTTKEVSLVGLKDGGTKLIQVKDNNNNEQTDNPVETKDVQQVIDDAGEWWIQTGPNSYEGLFISVGRMNSRYLGLSGCNVSTWSGAQRAITQAATATEILSKQRSKIGAQQNRLEHTFANVTNMAENAQAAESRIRDTDMAKEMVEQSKLNILEQMGTMMLSQANQSHQSVLQLLQ